VGAALLVSAIAGVAVIASAADIGGSAAPRSDTADPATRPTLAPPATAASSAVSRQTVRRVYGRGAAAVAVVRPAASEAPLPVVLFLHGWGYQRASAYGAWIRHLARRGNTVIVPRYQTGPRSDPAGVRAAMLRGVRTALRRIDAAPGTLVVAGHSAGAALAADYAAVARSHGLPRPRAIYAVYPGRAIIGTPGIPAADPARIPARTRLLVLAGARDAVVGQAPARQLVAAATSVRTGRRRLVVVHRPTVADHLAPLRSSRAARKTFWRRLDRLIEVARRGSSSASVRSTP